MAILKFLHSIKKRDTSRCLPNISGIIRPILYFLLLGNLSYAATPPNIALSNTVYANYSLQGTTTQNSANIIVKTAQRTPSVISFHKISNHGTPTPLAQTAYINATDVDSNFSNNPNSWQTIKNITLLDGTILNLPSNNYPIEPANQYLINEPIILEVIDYDQNKNPNTIENIFVTMTVAATGDTEIVQLVETSASSGVFRTIIQSTHAPTQANNGKLSVQKNAKIKVSYRDSFDQSDFSATAALVEPIGNIILTKKANKDTTAMGESVQYTLTMTTDNFPNGLTNVVIKDLLPPGFRYIDKTATLNNQAISTEKLSINGRHLQFNLGNMPALSQWDISYRLRVGPSSPYKKVENAATAYALGEQSFVAKAIVDVRDELMRSVGFISGRVLNGCGAQAKPQANIRIYLETGQSTTTDDQGFWQLAGINPGVHIVSMDTESLKAGVSPLLCTKHSLINEKGDSQFVNLHKGELIQTNFYVKGSATKKAITKNQPKDFNPLSYYNDDYANKANNSFEVLWPPKRYVPKIASMSVVVKHDQQYRVALILNGKSVSALNYQGASSNAKKKFKISRWRGIDIDINKPNSQLKILLKDRAGNIVEEKQRLIHFSGAAHSVEFLEDKSKLLADGQQSPVLTLRIKDNEGFPMRAKTHTYFSIEEGSYDVIDAEKDTTPDLTTYNHHGEHKLYIDNDGLARIRLQPTSQSGEIRIRIKLDEGNSKTISAWLAPHIRKEWLLVGIAESSAGYRQLKGNIQTLNDNDIKEGFYKRGRLAFFAKGKVLGKYLLTLAYDSDKPVQHTINKQQHKINPENWYSIYGTRSINQNEIASSSKIYLKLEREQFYFLFGNYQTNLSVTELSNYKRSLQGIHSEYKGSNFHYNISLSESSNRHQQDKIAGDGTSGEYFLSHSIIPNSETITLETRDRFHNEKIISQRQLSQHTDYEIDYDRKTIFFKFPIATRNANLHPNFIIVDYESEEDSEQHITAAGRVAYTSNNKKTEVGLSIIQEHDEKGNRQQLIGTDIHYRPDTETEFNLEYAQSKTKLSRSAWLIEAKKSSHQLSGRAYIRQQQQQFGIDHNSSDNASQKIGVDGEYTIDPNTSIRTDIHQKKNLDTKEVVKQASIELVKKMEQSNVHIGLRHSNEKTQTTHNQGTLVTLGGNMTPKDSPFNFHATIEKNISGNDNSTHNPDRLIIGAGYTINDYAQFFAEHEITRNKETTTQTNRVGINTKLWQGASLKTSINNENGGNNRAYADLGLAQHVKLSDTFNADINIDHSRHLNLSQSNNDSSDNDFTAYSVGLSWRDKTWAWTGRAEHRKSQQHNKSNLSYSLLHELGKGKDINAKVSISHYSQQDEATKKQATISIGAAWHPIDSRYSILQKLEYQYKNETAHDKTQKLINNIHLNKKINNHNQISLHHGIKYNLEQQQNTDEATTLDTLQLKARHNINEQWDLGLHGGYLHDWESDNWEYNYGVSIGYSPHDNIWLSAGYNFDGYSDNDFDESAYTHQGPYVQFNYQLNRHDLSRLFQRGKNIKITPSEEAKEENDLHLP